MRDAFGVEAGDDVSKAFGLRPVKDFVQGAKAAVGGWKNPASKAGAAGYGATQRTMGAAGRARTAGSQIKAAASAGGVAGTSAFKAKMPSIPKPSSTQMKVGGAIAGTAGVAGGAGYAAGKPDWVK
jgi:hypothetical protein